MDDSIVVVLTVAATAAVIAMMVILALCTRVRRLKNTLVEVTAEEQKIRLLEAEKSEAERLPTPPTAYGSQFYPVAAKPEVPKLTISEEAARMWEDLVLAERSVVPDPGLVKAQDAAAAAKMAATQVGLRNKKRSPNRTKKQSSEPHTYAASQSSGTNSQIPYIGSDTSSPLAPPRPLGFDTSLQSPAPPPRPFGFDSISSPPPNRPVDFDSHGTPRSSSHESPYGGYRDPAATAEISPSQPVSGGSFRPEERHSLSSTQPPTSLPPPAADGNGSTVSAISSIFGRQSVKRPSAESLPPTAPPPPTDNVDQPEALQRAAALRKSMMNRPTAQPAAQPIAHSNTKQVVMHELVSLSTVPRSSQAKSPRWPVKMNSPTKSKPPLSEPVDEAARRAAEVEAAKQAELDWDRKMKEKREAMKAADEARSRAAAEARERRAREEREAAEAAAAAAIAAAEQERKQAAEIARIKADREEREHEQKIAAMTPGQRRMYEESLEQQRKEKEWQTIR